VSRAARSERASRDDAVVIDGVRLTHPHKLLYPEQGLTKRDLVHYYQAVAPRMLPHLAKRPLAIVRCPRGHQARCFFQKQAPAGLVDTVATVQVQERHKQGNHMYVGGLPGLLGLVQLGVLEIHVWGSRVDRIDHPDRMVLDLDPAPGVPLGEVMDAAHLLRERLEGVRLESFVMTTGGKGLHLVVPIERRHRFDEVMDFAQAVAKTAARLDPDRFVARASKAERRGRIFIDYLRNGRGATAVCRYSTRARAGAPVATPLRWDELVPGLRPQALTVQEVARRAEQADPWQGYAKVRQRLSSAARRALTETPH
jgi:bifunctional non-homologous end joining protein LigD